MTKTPKKNKVMYVLTSSDVQNGIFNYDKKIDQLERLNKRDNRHSMNELIKIFPEAKEIIKQQLKNLNSQYNALSVEIENKFIKIYANKTDEFSIWFWTHWVKLNENDKFNNLSKKIREINSALYQPKIKEGKITDQMIQKAKEYPIINLIENRKGMALCPFHDDKRPSLNLKNNFAYCHSCGYTADTIKLYQDLNNCSFSESVKYLS